MASFVANGNEYDVFPAGALSIHDKLPPGLYTVKERPTPAKTLYLECVEPYALLDKYYGNVIPWSNRIMTTFQSRPASTGVMLTGDKGSGKTLLAKYVCMQAVENGYPVIIINTQLAGESFNTFIQSISQPAVVLFDEFEKIYDAKKQEQILTLLDGTFPSKKLFIFTCNDKWKVDSHLRNRPGRIYYLIDYKGVEAEFIREYCDDNGVSPSHTEELVRYAGLFNSFSFDILKAAVEEMQRYNESPLEALRLLNAKPEYEGYGHDSKQIFELEATKNGTKLKPHYPDQFKGNPLSITTWDAHFLCDDADDRELSVTLTLDKLVSMDAVGGVFVFKDGDITVTMRRMRNGFVDYTKLL